MNEQNGGEGCPFSHCCPGSCGRAGAAHTWEPAPFPSSCSHLPNTAPPSCPHSNLSLPSCLLCSPKSPPVTTSAPLPVPLPCPEVYVKTRPTPTCCSPLPVHLCSVLPPLFPTSFSVSFHPSPPLSPLAVLSTCLQGSRASYPEMFGGVSVGPCPWGSSLGAVLAALAAQEGREQGPGEGGGRREGAPGPSAGRGKEWLAECPGTRRGLRDRMVDQCLEA